MKDNKFKDNYHGDFGCEVPNMKTSKTDSVKDAKAKSSTRSAHSSTGTHKTTSHASKPAGTTKTKRSTAPASHKSTTDGSGKSGFYNDDDYILVEEIIMIEEEEF